MREPSPVSSVDILDFSVDLSGSNREKRRRVDKLIQL